MFTRIYNIIILQGFQGRNPKYRGGNVKGVS
jgi:hypothetical protein